MLYQKTELPNGLRVVSHNMKERDSVALGVWVAVGGRYEEDRIKGTAHFLEHILFKGSAKYSCSAIKERVEGVGGSLNAFTAEEQTCYFAKIPAPHLESTFDILADMVFHPLIKKRDVEKERTVILEEIKMYHDLPQYYVIDLLDQMMWPNHPLGKMLAGTAASVSGLTRQDIKAFHQNHYAAGQVVVTACGNIRHRDLVDLVKKKSRAIPPGKAHPFGEADNSQDAPRVKFSRRKIEQMHLALGMLSIEDDHKDKYVQYLLHVIMGGNMSSRFFNEVREKRGLAYSISTSVKSLRDTGMFMVRAGVDNTKVVEAVEVIIKELRRIREGGVTRSEFNRARDYYLGQILLGLEDTLDHMLWLGESIVSRNRLRTLQDVIQSVKKIKSADIKRLAERIFQENRYNLAVVGPLSDGQESRLRRLVQGKVV